MENRSLLTYLGGGVAFILRIVPHIPNVTPFGGMALFAGSQNSKRSLLTLFIVLFVSDLLLGLHKTMFFVYLSFFIAFYLGKIFLQKRTFPRMALVSFFSSCSFFIITNFGSWITTSVYQKNLMGLLNAYSMGLPFFRNTLLGDMFYTIVIFYGLPFLIKKMNFVNKLITHNKKEVLTIS
jgi:hypothetical protein